MARATTSRGVVRTILVSDAPADLERAAVLAALAGVRHGHAVADAGGPARACRALQGASGGRPLVTEDADVVLAGPDERQAAAGVLLLVPGGRMVALAPDRTTAQTLAARLGLALRHVEVVPDGVAWCATLPTAG